MRSVWAEVTTAELSVGISWSIWVIAPIRLHSTSVSHSAEQRDGKSSGIDTKFNTYKNNEVWNWLESESQCMSFPYLVILVSEASRVVQEYDFQGLQCLWDGRRHLDRADDWRTTGSITYHGTHQWNDIAVQSPSQQRWIHKNEGNVADIHVKTDSKERDSERSREC